MGIEPGVTMREVAVAAGVSVATVSRALRSHPAIPARTRDRVWEAARQLGYVPNPMVQALMTRIRRGRPAGEAVVACLHGRSPHRWVNAAQEWFLRGMGEEGERMGYTIEYFPWPWVGGVDDLVRTWRARNVRAVVLSSVALGVAGARGLPWGELAWVAHSRVEGAPAIHRVGNEIYAIVKLACLALVERGYRRPGLAVNLEGPMRDGLRWVGAFLAQGIDRGNGFDAVPVFDGEWSRGSFEWWLRRASPDVVLSMSEDPLRWLRRCGCRVPGEVGFLHLGVGGGAADVSGVRQHHGEVGAAAVHLVDGLLRRNELGIPAAAKVVTLSGSWHEGATLRAGGACAREGAADA